ncbi:MAG TPA: LuxR C-terminal-related transcriptional regulator, partial [Candidatus Dormibacteraeota bacterium]|nr:LuxR C-terminal-related transcriptional regulator [Candidatus Dormibacteraeota bacterium]
PHEGEAVELFVQRARAASGTFELTRANQSAVADICRRLDGLPLALELAAVRTRALSAEQILERLTDRFALLTGGGRGALPRHQTLETAINWSHDLLTDDERRAFRRLCVFAGRFTLEDAAQVCDASVDVMSSLVDKSLVIKEDATAMARYRLHETMREYAQKKLAQANEVGELSERCTDYYAMRCRATALDARFHLLEWLAWTDLEIDNIRAILRHCMTARDSTRGLDLATALSWFWITRATTEGARWLDELLSLEPSDPANVAWAYFLRGFLGVLQGDWQASLPVLTQGIAWCHRHRLPEQLVHTLSMAAIAEVLAGDRDAAGRYLNSAEELAAQADDVTTRLSILQARSLNAIVAGDAEAAHAAATEGERLSRQAGDLYSRHMMLLNLGGAAILAGDPPASKPVFEEALKLAYQIDDRIGEFYLLAALAYHNATAGRTKIAAQLLGASDAIRTGAGATVMAMLAPFVDQAQEMATNALGETRFRLEFDTGRRLPRDAAVQLALGNSPSTEKPPPNTEDGQLSNRETDVARLVADGLSNKQIGARLFISERTVDSHVRSILNKLGFDSRAQIAGWIAGRGPGF